MDNNEVVTEEVAAVVENNTGIEIEPLFEEQVDFDTFSKSDFRVVKVKNCEAVPKSKKLLRFTLDDGTENERTILSGVHAFYEPEELVGKTLLAIVNLPPRSMMGIDSCGMLLSAIHNVNGEEKLNLVMTLKASIDRARYIIDNANLYCFLVTDCGWKPDYIWEILNSNVKNEIAERVINKWNQGYAG